MRSDSRPRQRTKMKRYARSFMIPKQITAHTARVHVPKGAAGAGGFILIARSHGSPSRRCAPCAALPLGWVRPPRALLPWCIPPTPMLLRDVASCATASRRQTRSELRRRGRGVRRRAVRAIPRVLLADLEEDGPGGRAAVRVHQPRLEVLVLAHRVDAIVERACSE